MDKQVIERKTSVEKMIEDANRHSRRQQSAEKIVRQADKLRRETAQDGHDPRFPEGWGEPLAKFFVTYRFTENGTEETVHPVRPSTDQYLTVYRFGGFEATATFDRYYFGPHEDLNWERTPPPSGAWKEAGPTENRSTLWTRTRSTGGQRDD
ncbi:hypothetical protein ROJ8625_00132 [Roseivivax jejudonensis]|uniref:Uncharacterized protein n=1 Tax=Roseivivax jejudonensis TaxID=1529041 RepID=A0A1X6Y468_9RHOB|nr:hypothetical protein [Roseivivax jejudonensis]SLN09972.1 hypothetical protein ROJ8625_00132 [Roseivivax jejudonensis]